MILVDTNVLVDIVSDDPLWAEWSQRHLTLAAAEDQLAINDIVYAELSIRFATIEELDAMIRDAHLVSAAIPRLALFLAGKAFQRYRYAGGVKTGVLPDFFIGAHAVISASTLITRDAARYRTYFPGIMLIAPN
ncbi:MAG: type II toxin-antitoxin system VapC family toxin [Acetobacteraceae bacterium]|nr:type II toxin-antitoxin system VapC family toxin [Acetobacteraceae bacterium]